MNKKFLCTGAFIVLFSGILLLLFLKGAIPIPSTVGLEYTDEIQMDVQSLAYASTAASQCKSQGIDMDSSKLDYAISNLANGQYISFVSAQTRIKKLETEISNSECKSLKKDLGIMADKKLVIID